MCLILSVLNVKELAGTFNQLYYGSYVTAPPHLAGEHQALLGLEPGPRQRARHGEARRRPRQRPAHTSGRGENRFPASAVPRRGAAAALVTVGLLKIAVISLQ